MSFRQLGLGAEVRITVASLPTTTVVIKDGVKITPSIEILPIATTPFYSMTFTPVETGSYDIAIDGVLVAFVEIVTTDVFTFLRNLEDQAFGGWEWDKTTKVMTLYRQDGSTLGTYESDDTLELAYSRQTITP